tara:strand:+ start:251 stop:382 length:132 start_codon:yes stop_codon:yes gene_type:complete
MKKILLISILLVSACHSITQETVDDKKIWFPCDVWGCDKKPKT